ncbi:MAG: tRNA(Ile)-lysidine synthase [Candidatus Erwinia impunctatus]
MKSTEVVPQRGNGELISIVSQHLQGNEHLVVAYSGGIDSTVLLHLLVCLRQRNPALTLRAIHIHHGLNPAADQWVTHCQQRCLAWQVPFQTISVVVKSAHKGIEAGAREARYAALKQALKPDEIVVTAQHIDDQCETLLLALKRGSGPAGLSAMPVETAFSSGKHLRPLLSVSRQQIEEWASEHQLSWIDDDSNDDQRYDRNFLRQAVLPPLMRRWPEFAANCARSAALCAEQEQLIDELLADSLSALIDDEGALTFTALTSLSEPHRNALLRRWITKNRGMMPSRVALQHLWQEVACSRQDATPCFRYGDAEVRRYRQRLYWLPRQQPEPFTDSLHWPSPWLPLLIPGNRGCVMISSQGDLLRRPREDEQVSVRFNIQGHFRLAGRTGSRALKKIWQELAVPPWRRAAIPMLFYDEVLIAALGVFVTIDGTSQGEDDWQVHWNQE